MIFNYQQLPPPPAPEKRPAAGKVRRTAEVQRTRLLTVSAQREGFNKENQPIDVRKERKKPKHYMMSQSEQNGDKLDPQNSITRGGLRV